MKIDQVTLSDIETVFELYQDAIDYQKEISNWHWKGFEVELVTKEINEGRTFKLIDSNKVACIFTLTYSDPEIWPNTSGDAAIYIHRISTKKNYHGRGYVSFIIDWCKNYAKNNNIQFLRMDTWGDNQKLIAYYEKCGFKLLGYSTPGPTPNLPEHYWNSKLGLLEIKLFAN